MEMYALYLLNTYLRRLKRIERGLRWAHFRFRILLIEQKYASQYLDFQRNQWLLRLQDLPQSPPFRIVSSKGTTSMDFLK